MKTKLMIMIIVMVAALASCGTTIPSPTVAPAVTVTQTQEPAPTVTVTQTAEPVETPVEPGISIAMQKTILNEVWSTRTAEDKRMICLYWRTSRSEALQSFREGEGALQKFDTEVVEDFFDSHCAG